MNEQQPKQNSSSRQSVAAAHENSGGNGISFEAPVQLKLIEGRTYKCIQEENLYYRANTKSSTKKTIVGNFYTVIKHENSRTQLREAGNLINKRWVVERTNEDDKNYYQLINPKLYEKSDPNPEVSGNDPKYLIEGNMDMFVFNKNHESMPQSPKCEDVEQGGLTDCSLMSSLSSMAFSSHYRKVLKSNFEDKKGGQKEVKLFEPQKEKKRKEINDLDKYESTTSKKQKTISVDMVFPFKPEGKKISTNDNNAPAFVYAQPNEDVFENVKSNKSQPTWPMVYESAMAMELGNDYTGLDDKEPEEMLSRLTGETPIIYPDDDMITYWKEVQGILAEGGAVVAVTLKKVTDKDRFKDDHSYTVIAIESDSVTLLDTNKDKIENVTDAELKANFMKYSVLRVPKEI